MAKRVESWLNKIYAYLMGYFWRPCPVCGEYFGGHQTKLGGIKITERGEMWEKGLVICDTCTSLGKGDK